MTRCNHAFLHMVIIPPVDSCLSGGPFFVSHSDISYFLGEMFFVCGIMPEAHGNETTENEFRTGNDY